MAKTTIGKIPAIKEQSPRVRAEYCRKFLFLSGFLTDSENEKARKRIAKFSQTPAKKRPVNE